MHAIEWVVFWSIVWHLVEGAFALVWLFYMPFKLAGMKPLLRELIYEQRRTNEYLYAMDAEAGASAPVLRATRDTME